jgi:hypothetical protein
LGVRYIFEIGEKAMFPELVKDLLKQGYRVKFNATGHSMYPTILANEPVMVDPIDPAEIHRGDIILYRSNGSLVAHRVMGILTENGANDFLTIIKAFAADTDRTDQCPLDKVESTKAFQKSKTDAASGKFIFILRGDASRTFDEPVEGDQIVGKVISIERNGSSINPYGLKHRLACWLFKTAFHLKIPLGLAKPRQKLHAKTGDVEQGLHESV